MISRFRDQSQSHGMTASHAMTTLRSAKKPRRDSNPDLALRWVGSIRLSYGAGNVKI